MHIALISCRFKPETSPGAKRITELDYALRAEGHQTTVLTQLPHYPDPSAFEDFSAIEGKLLITQSEADQEVRRFRPRIAAKRDLASRLLAEARFAYLTSRYGTRLSGIDGVLATSPYIFNLWSARTYRVPAWLDLRDLTWEYSRDLRGHNLLFSSGSYILKSIALSCFRAAARISTTTERQRRYLIDNGVQPQKIEVVPNGVPRKIFDDLNPSAVGPRREGPLRIVYAGLLGFPQGLGFAIGAMEAFSGPAVEFHIYGEGVDRQSLMAYCRSRDLKQVHFHGHVPYEVYLEALANADILYASLRSGDSLFAAMPSKVWEYMAAGKPILFAGAGEGAEAIECARAGVCLSYGDKEAFQANLRHLLEDEFFRRECGENGRQWVKAHRIRETINKKWVAHIAELLGGLKLSARQTRLASSET